jgi:hypothetical protein
MLTIDLSNHTSYTSFVRNIVLDDIPCKLKFRYNTLKDFWTVELQDENSNPIKTYKCICNFDITMREIAIILPYPKGNCFL